MRRVLTFPWMYPRAVSTAAVAGVSVGSTLAVRAALPSPVRPQGTAPIVLASVASYAAVRVGAHKGWTKAFKHRVVDPLGGDVDDATTLVLAAVAGGAALFSLQISRGACGRVRARRRRA